MTDETRGGHDFQLPNKAVVLLSGGLNSYVAAARAAAAGFELHAITFNYGQLATGELKRAGQIGQALGVADHVLVNLNLRGVAPSPLTGSGPLPLDRSVEQIVGGGVAPTYTPGRNLILLSLAAAHAETIGAGGLIVGFDGEASRRYPDTKGEFLQGLAACLATGAGAGASGRPFVVAAPLMELSKADVVRLALELKLDLSLPASCYRQTPADEAGCGRCDACIMRRKAFSEAGVLDPASQPYRNREGLVQTPGGIVLPGQSVPQARGKILLPGSPED